VLLDIAFANDDSRTTIAGCNYAGVRLHLTGFITVPTASAVFKIQSNDGGYATIDGNSFGAWVDQSCKTTSSSTMSFTANSPVVLDVWYFNFAGGGCFRLLWDIGAGFVNVPASAFTYLP
jgi:hypothetical protein